MAPKTALIIRATGSQGKGVTKYLLKAGWTIHALVRDPEDARAIALKDQGAQLFKGEIKDYAATEAAIKGCDAVFLNQMPSFVDDAETRDASNVIDLAKKEGVKHIVHATTLSLNAPDPRAEYGALQAAPALLGKYAVEELVRASGINWTIIRPGYFMTNLVLPISPVMFPDLAEGTLTSSYYADTVLPLVDPDQIGQFAAAAFEDLQKHGGTIISVVSEKVTIEDVLTQISEVGGKPIQGIYRTEEETEKEVAAGNMFVAGQLVTRSLAKHVDMDEVKSLGIPLTTFRDFLRRHKEFVIPK